MVAAPKRLSAGKRVTGPFTASFGGGNAVAGRWEISRRAKCAGAGYEEDPFARSRCGVNPFFEADPVNAAGLEAFDGFEQFFEGAAGAIETGNREAVAGPSVYNPLLNPLPDLSPCRPDHG